MTIKNFALIIGSVKCGTTSLFNYLAEHPQIAACSTKEPDFFSHRRPFSQGYDYYRSLWNWNPNIHKIALEASPNYTRVTNSNLLKTVENIADFATSTDANFKFIYIMRNPIERIESHYTHLEAWRCEPNIKPFSEGIDAEIIDVSRYAMQIDQYYKKFSADSILLLNFEDLKTDPLKVVKKVCQFLEVDPEHEFQGLHTIHNKNSERTIIALPRWNSIRKTKLVKSIVRLVPSEARQLFRKIFGRKNEFYVRLSPEQREFVLRELQQDLIKLDREYEVDVSRWGIEKS